MHSHADAKAVLSANLAALKAREGIGTRAWAHRLGVGEGTLARAVAGSNAVTLDTLERIAQHYRLEPWQLLCPDFEPNNPPITAKVDQAQRALLDKLKTLSDLLPRS